jgi:exodeoxyribonuclease VII large subunit
MEAAGKGALMAVLLERKERLGREGLFNRKRPLPAFPKRIGIVTSATGAVLRDILHRLSDRFPCEVLLWAAQVQGPGSIEQVTRAIVGMNALGDDLRPDVLIVARGGGSLEDLWTFNEEVVVRAVAHSQIPIISAIGHETDTTLCDYAADVRAPTPTAAAELATPVAAQILATLNGMCAHMSNVLIRQLRHDWVNLKGLARGLPQPQQLLENAMQRLDDGGDRLSRAIDYRLMVLGHRVQVLSIKHPAETLRLNQQNFANFQARFKRAAQVHYEKQAQSLGALASRLEQASYTKILDKGFSFVSVNGALVATAAAFPRDAAEVTLNFADGAVTIEPKKIR